MCTNYFGKSFPFEWFFFCWRRRHCSRAHSNPAGRSYNVLVWWIWCTFAQSFGSWDIVYRFTFICVVLYFDVFAWLAKAPASRPMCVCNVHSYAISNFIYVKPGMECKGTLHITSNDARALTGDMHIGHTHTKARQRKVPSLLFFASIQRMTIVHVTQFTWRRWQHTIRTVCVYSSNSVLPLPATTTHDIFHMAKSKIIGFRMHLSMMRAPRTLIKKVLKQNGIWHT